MKRYFWLFLMAGLGLACAVASPVPTPVATEIVVTEIMSPESTVTQTPMPPAPPTPVPTATEPATAVLLCVTPQEEITLQAGAMADYPAAILAFLNQGGTPDALRAALEMTGFGNPSGSVMLGDFTGDGVDDLAVSLIDGQRLDQPPAAAQLEIYVCQGGAFALAYDQPAELDFSMGVHLWLAQDLNGDGAAELVAGETVCGASTCFENVRILAWDGNTFTNQLTDRTDDLPFPTVEVIDPDGNGVFDLVIRAGGLGSVGAGPQRGQTKVWQYDPGQELWAFASNTPDPAVYRLHALHDADAAANRGDFEAALALYDRVINDDTLQDWVDPATERATLSAFALYRELTLYLHDGNAAQAEAILLELQTRFPPDSAQRGYVDMALLFRDTYPTGWDAACAAVTDFAATHAAQILDSLGSMAFGYGNPDYTPEMMCVGP